mmetsp:Transcript_35611/g.85323  ORF Transcript_35611/g.85323 Transcript_35611/m.85323 type:complete len:321 (-) Transcript_35611:2459-3421(-)
MGVRALGNVRRKQLTALARRNDAAHTAAVATHFILRKVEEVVLNASGIHRLRPGHVTAKLEGIQVIINEANSSHRGSRIKDQMLRWCGLLYQGGAGVNHKVGEVCQWRFHGYRDVEIRLHAVVHPAPSAPSRGILGHRQASASTCVRLVRLLLHLQAVLSDFQYCDLHALCRQLGRDQLRQGRAVRGALQHFIDLQLAHEDGAGDFPHGFRLQPAPGEVLHGHGDGTDGDLETQCQGSPHRMCELVSLRALHDEAGQARDHGNFWHHHLILTVARVDWHHLGKVDVVRGDQGVILWGSPGEIAAQLTCIQVVLGKADVGH